MNTTGDERLTAIKDLLVALDEAIRLAQTAGCARKVWHNGYNMDQLLRSARVLAEDALDAQERGQAMTGATNEQ